MFWVLIRLVRNQRPAFEFVMFYARLLLSIFSTFNNYIKNILFSITTYIVWLGAFEKRKTDFIEGLICVCYCS